MRRTALVTVEVDVEVAWDDESTDEYGDALNAWRGSMDELGDGWLFEASNREDVLHHLAYNAVTNGIRSSERLDGWAGSEALARMDVIGFTPLSTWAERDVDLAEQPERPRGAA